MRQEEWTQSYPDWQGTLWLDSFGIIRTNEGKIWLTDCFLQHLNVSDMCIYILQCHNELMVGKLLIISITESIIQRIGHMSGQKGDILQPTDK